MSRSTTNEEATQGFITLTDWMDTERKQWESADGTWRVRYVHTTMHGEPAWLVHKNERFAFRTREHREVLVAVGDYTLGTITE